MPDDPLQRWASCGAMRLTGDLSGPPLAPPTTAGVVADRVAGAFGLDAGVLTERAAMLGLRRGGQVSCGGATRLLRSADGWVALALPRPSDVASVPALLGVEDVSWVSVARTVRAQPGLCLQERAALLGVPLAVVGSFSGPAMRVEGAARPGRARSDQLLVVTLAALWAGPLCAHLLGRLGARVVKVEDPARPDGTRGAAPEWRDLLLGGQESVAVAIRTPSGRAALIGLLEQADVIITSARARAFDQLGIDLCAILAASSDKVWVSVTGYGWDSDRVGFGDDAAAAAGLVAWHPHDGRPRFAGDAIADPLSGLLAADTARKLVESGGRWFVDASLAGAAASVAPPCGAPAVAAVVGPGGAWTLNGVVLDFPQARQPASVARRPGADN